MNDTQTCSARTRAGAPCKRGPVPGKNRCKLHGGMSTGSTTDAGKAKRRIPPTAYTPPS